MNDLYQNLHYHWLSFNTVTATRGIILLQGKIDIFISLFSFSHSVWSKLGDFSVNDDLSTWALVPKSSEVYPKLCVDPAFLVYKSVGKYSLPVLKEWGLCSTVLSPNYLNFTLEDKSLTLAKHLFRRLQQLEIQEEQICCSIPTASPDTVNKKRSWQTRSWKLWTYRLIDSGRFSWQKPHLQT